MCKSLLIISLLLAACRCCADDKRSPDESGKQALGKLQSFIGQWRGVGQPQRGSTNGAWVEEPVWEWRFSKEGPSVHLNSPKSKLLVAWEIRPTATKDRFELDAKKMDSDEVETYEGGFDAEGKLVFVNDSPADGFPARISVRMVAENKRMVVLYERKFQSDRYFRMAELGLTRKGSGFGQGTSFNECVVTGGQGTIPVTYEGKTYYVCCGGCRDFFNDDPATVLAEYRERKQAEQKEKAQ